MLNPKSKKPNGLHQFKGIVHHKVDGQHTEDATHGAGENKGKFFICQDINNQNLHESIY